MEQLTFTQACSAIHQRVFQEDFDREIKEDNYLNQSAFADCRQRAVAGLSRANRAVENFVTLCIILSREDKENEKRETEKTELIAIMEVEQPEDVITAKTMSFWMG